MTTYSHRAVWAIAVPMILSNLSVPLVGFVDAAVMGHLDHPRYLAAVGAGAQIFGVIYMGMNFLRMGTTGLCAQAFGLNDPKELRSVLFHSVVIAALLGFILFVFQNPIKSGALAILQPAPDVAASLTVYYDIRIWSAPVTLVNFVLVGWLLGLQDARGPLWVLITINGTNVILDFVFVVFMGWQADGVALASVIAETLGLAVGLLLAAKALTRHPGSWEASGLWNWDKLKAIFAINGNIFIRTLALMFSFAFITTQSTRLGTTILAVNTVLLNFQFFMAYALDGFANAAEALVGRAIGAKERAGFDRAVRICMQWSVGLSLVFVAVYVLLGRWVIDVITNIQAIRDTAHVYLPWVIVLPIISVWSFVYDGIYVGATQARAMRDVMLLSTFGVFVPAWYLLRPLENHGLWFAFACFMAARALFMYGWFKRIDKRGGFVSL